MQPVILLFSALALGSSLAPQAPPAGLVPLPAVLPDTEATDVAVDGEGNAYILGVVRGPFLPATSGAVQPKPGGGVCIPPPRLGSVPCPGVLSLGPGGAMEYSTFLGGSHLDATAGIALGPDGSLYVTGQTSSHDSPSGAGGFGQDRRAPGSGDAFVVRFAPGTRALDWSAFFPRSSGHAVAAARDGSVFVTGTTLWPDLPVTPEAIQPRVGYVTSGYVARLEKGGGALAAATYLTGGDPTQPVALALDRDGNPVVAGWTAAYDLP